MNKKYKIILIVFILLLFSFSFIASVLAAPPITGVSFDFPTGFVIVDNPQSTIKYNTSYQYNFFVYNSTNGVLIDDSSVVCVFYLANYTGEVLYFGVVDYYIDGYWRVDIEGDNFTELNYYGYGLKCNSSVQGGAKSGILEVTPTGTELTTSQSNLSIGILLSIVLLLFFFGLIGLKFMDGEKTFPIGLFFLLLSMILSVYGIYLGLVLSRDYLFPSVANTQSALFIGVLFGLIGIIFISLLFLILKALDQIKEKKEQKKRGEGYDSSTRTYKY